MSSIAQSQISTSPPAPTTFVTSALTSSSSGNAANSNAAFTTKFALLSNDSNSSPSSTSAFTRAVQSSAIDLSPFATATNGFDDDPGLYDPPPHDSREGSIAKYYFVFLALFIISLLVGLWFLKRRRIRMKMAFYRHHSENQRRDGNTMRTDGRRRPSTRSWRGAGTGRMNSGRRRWMQGGAPWHNQERTVNRTSTRRDEGLNELGEAPPAYVKELDIDGSSTAPSISIASIRSPSEDEELRPPVEPASMLQTPTIPLRTLSREERDRSASPYQGAKPPDYETAVNASNSPRPSESR